MESKHVFRMSTAAIIGIMLGALPNSDADAQSSKLRILQTNADGRLIHVIDPATNAVIGEIFPAVGQDPNWEGVVTSPDGMRIYAAGAGIVDIIDGTTLKIIKEIDGGQGRIIDITPDGRRIYFVTDPDFDMRGFPFNVKLKNSGRVHVIDTTSLQEIKTIPLGDSFARPGRVVGLSVTPDGKYVICSTDDGMVAVDTQTNDIAWTMPMNQVYYSQTAVSKNPDGSTRTIYTWRDDTHFQVVDFATRKITDTIKIPDIPNPNQFTPYGSSAGIKVTPDQKMLLVGSGFNGTTHAYLYAYSLPDLRFIGMASLGSKGADWVTVSPDSKTAYVADWDQVSVVDIESMKQMARIPVGSHAGRNTVWMPPR